MSQPLAQRDKGILSDAELLELADFTPFTEGEPVLMCEPGWEPFCCFWHEATEVAKAIAAEATRLSSGQARALFAMRGFYFLGILRGGEAYRNSLIDTETEPEFTDLPFQLDSGAAADFVDDMNELTPELFNQLCALLGLSVPWAADRAKGGAET